MGRRPVVTNGDENGSRSTVGAGDSGPARLGRLFGAVVAGAVGVAVLAACTAQDGGGDGPRESQGTASAGPPAKGSAGASKAPGGPAAREAGKKLLKAAEKGDTAGVRAALKAGAGLETRDGQGRTPLLLAATNDHVEAARALVKAGADPDARDQQDDSAWLVTGVTGSVEMARVLVPAKPDYTLTNRFGGTSLIPASERGHVAYVREVLRTTGIKVNHVNRLGWTALLEAVILGDGGRDHQKIVGLLLDAGADPDIADKDGVSPLKHAEQRGYDEIAKLLRDA